MLHCIERMREALPGIIIEVRMDGAFFGDDIVSALDWAHIAYTISVPFERFPAHEQVTAFKIQREFTEHLEILDFYSVQPGFHTMPFSLMTASRSGLSAVSRSRRLRMG